MLLLFTSSETNKNDQGLFWAFITFGVTIAYFIHLLILKRRNKKEQNENRLSFEWLLLLTIFEISAFTLNHSIPIFDDSATWVTIMLILANISMGYILIPTQSHKNPIIYRLAVIAVAASIPLFLYYTIYLMPFAIFSIIGLIFFGLSAHIFAPLLMIIFFIYQLRLNVYNSNPKLRIYILIGITLPLFSTIFFLEYWRLQTNKIDQIINHQTITENDELPIWVEIAQKLPKNFVTEKIIKSQINFSSNNFEFFRNPINRFNKDRRKHDPLVVLAQLTIDNPNLSEDANLKILKTQYGKKYELNEHLWGDENLKTTSIVTQVMLMPQYRIAYTEKVLTIQNTQKFSQGEAIYTFELPPNSTVSSLSLWINDKEQKAAITTKLKAETAYKQIVGVEMRDPVTVSWKEGNKVVVRVFPCTIDNPRKFKIGITSPLQLQKNTNKLMYQNIAFEGPNSQNATESIKIQSETKLSHLSSWNIEFAPNQIIDQQYTPNWTISFDAPTLSKNVFSFDSAQYCVKPIMTQNATFEFNEIYLDINSEWREKEIEKCINSPFKTYIYCNNRFVEKKDPDFQACLKQLQNLNFSVFPYYKILPESNALIITKNSNQTPNIEDLRSLNSNFNDTISAPSKYHVNLNKFMANNFKPNVYAINNQPGNVLKSLIDLNAVKYYYGTVAELTQFLKIKSNQVNINNDTVIAIPEAGISLIKSHKTNAISSASNHLMRLFAYNHMVQTVGKKFITEPHKVTEDQIQEALVANVVTPVSNLIVLETSDDYKRFNINENQSNSLKNASIKSAGSVPEPHEWILIIMGLTFILFFTLKQWKSGL